MDYFRAFRAPSKFAQEFLFFTDGLGQLKSKDFLIDRSGYDNYLVMYVLSGKLHVEQNGHHVLVPGEGIVMRLMDWHKYYTDEADICEILWIHFNGRQVGTLLKVIEQTGMLPAVFRNSCVESLIRHCFTLFQKNPEDREFLVSGTIYSMILSILYTVSKENLPAGINQGTEFINRAGSFVDNNIYSKITLADFAGHFNISPFHFCRVFEKNFGITPMKYVLSKKIELSKYLLKYTHDPISSIANSLCFTDQSHFTKAFKAVQGESPLAFRKKRW